MILAPSSESAAKVERRDTVLEIARQLLEERRDQKVLSLISQVLARNAELEKRLAGAHAFKNSETSRASSCCC